MSVWAGDRSGNVDQVSDRDSGGPVVFAGISAIEMALWNIKEDLRAIDLKFGIDLAKGTVTARGGCRSRRLS